MTDMTLDDTDLDDGGLTDLGPFFERYDRHQRFLFGGALCASLVLSAVIATRLIDTGGLGGKSTAGVVGMGVLFAPLFTVVWWTFAEFMVRQRRKTAQPDGRHLAGPIDARNARRIANGGFVFNIGLVATGIAQQVGITMMLFGYPPMGGWLGPQLVLFVIGGLTLYLGNLWPKMPAPRAPERAAATLMKGHRLGGWIMVTAGLFIILLGLCLPLLHPGLHP